MSVVYGMRSACRREPRTSVNLTERPVPNFGTGCRGFESLQVRHCSPTIGKCIHQHSVTLPSATIFLLLLCNDREVLGPWTNPAWLNAIASVIIAILLMLSGVLVVITVFPSMDVGRLVVVLSVLLLLGLTFMSGMLLRGRHARVADKPSRLDRATWRMPPLALLKRPPWSRGRLVGMWALRGYLVMAVLLLS